MQPAGRDFAPPSPNTVADPGYNSGNAMPGFWGVAGDNKGTEPFISLLAYAEEASGQKTAQLWK